MHILKQKYNFCKDSLVNNLNIIIYENTLLVFANLVHDAVRYSQL